MHLNANLISPGHLLRAVNPGKNLKKTGSLNTKASSRMLVRIHTKSLKRPAEQRSLKNRGLMSRILLLKR